MKEDEMKKRSWVLILFLILMASCATAQTADWRREKLLGVKPQPVYLTKGFSWDAPTQNTDCTPLVNLAGFKFYYGTRSGNYTKMIDIGMTTRFKVSLKRETYYFAVKAYTTDGTESDFSNEVVERFR